ncbi:MAG: ABC transporter permease subunit [Deinococcales bacterium]
MMSKKIRKAQTSYIPKFSFWTLLIALIAFLLSAPILAILMRSFAPTAELWQHFSQHLLGRYVLNSLILMLGVGLGVMLLGLSSAWLVTMCDFPGRRIFQWALLLPMAFPAYILAYSYTDLLQYSGPIQAFLREVFNWSRGDYVFPEIRSRMGAVMMLSLALYPYVYMTSRASFLEQSASILEASRNLGRGAWASFFHISLPLARPAIVAGVALALMETLSDFGTVDYFAIQTFATGIYKYWLSFEASGKALHNSPACSWLP